MKISSYLWAVPFISFLLGYYSVSFFYRIPVYATPALLGTSLQEAVAQLSDLHLNLRIIGRKQDNDLPTGTIISQMPQPKTKIKANQSIYCVISEKDAASSVPHLIKKTKDSLITELNAIGLRFMLFYVESMLPVDTCIAQWPQPGQLLQDNQKLIVYLSAGSNKPIIWPNFKTMAVNDVVEHLAMYGITPTITHRSASAEQHACSDACIIVDQRPLPGSIVPLQQDMTVQLQVSLMQGAPERVS